MALNIRDPKLLSDMTNRWLLTAIVCLLIAGASTSAAQDLNTPYTPLQPTVTLDPLLVAGENPCPEGQYRDYADLTGEILCRDLLRNTGFNLAAFEAALPDHVIEVDDCDWDSVATALIAIGDLGGGTIRLPACTIEASRLGIRIPSNLLLEGAGMGKTIIHQVDQNMGVFNFRSQHVVMRDFTVDGGTNPIQALYSNNLLFERLEIKGARLNGLTFSYSTDVTVRYTYSHENQQNGILSKDCFPGSIKLWKCPDNPDDPDDPSVAACRDALQITLALCEETVVFVADSVHRHPIEPGALWTNGYAVYSNQLHNSLTSHGAALHARNGEIAGNWFMGNQRGLKLPDSEDVWIHHNLFENNIQFALHIYAVIQDHPPTNHRIFANQIHNNGDFALRIEGVSQVVLINNHYSGNFACFGPSPSSWCATGWKGKDAIRLDWAVINGVQILPDVFVCPQFQDARLEIAGNFLPGIAPSEFCNLTVPNENETPAAIAGLELYPNPTSGRIRLSYSPAVTGPVLVELYDALGRRVSILHQGDHAASSRVEVQADVTGFPPGSYFARISDREQWITAPVIIHR